MNSQLSLDELLASDGVTIGSILCGERLTKGKSIDDVYKELKIQKALIESFESNEIDKSKNPVLLLGHLRTYANYLELDANAVVQAFSRHHELNIKPSTQSLSQHSGSSQLSSSKAKKDQISQSKPHSQHLLAPTKFPQANHNKNQNWVKNFPFHIIPLVLFFLALIGAGSWGVISFYNNTQNTIISSWGGDYSPPVIAAVDTDISLNNAAIAPENMNIDLGDIVEQQPLSAPVVTPRVGRIADIALPSQTNPVLTSEIAPAEDEPVQDVISPIVSIGPTIPEITLMPKDESWVLLVNDSGKEIFRGLLAPGEIFSVPMNDGLVVLRKGGNATSLFVRVDDQVFGPLGGESDSVVSNVPLTPATLETSYVAADSDLVKEIEAVEEAYQSQLASAE